MLGRSWENPTLCFPNGSFLNVKLGKRPSYVILWGKELAVKRTDEEWGNDRSIQIYEYQWLSKEKTFKTLYLPRPLTSKIVDDLICSDRGWKSDLVREIFFRKTLIWYGYTVGWKQSSRYVHMTLWQGRMYSVKSGYKVAMEEENVATTSKGEDDTCNVVETIMTTRYP